MNKDIATELPQKLVVYGTLMSGFVNHHYLAGAQFLGADCLDVITLYDLGPYPGAIFEPSKGIAVEVFAVDSMTVQILDELEEVDWDTPRSGMYTRRTCDTRYGSAWIYIYNRDFTGLMPIRCGAWGALKR